MRCRYKYLIKPGPLYFWSPFYYSMKPCRYWSCLYLLRVSHDLSNGGFFSPSVARGLLHAAPPPLGPGQKQAERGTLPRRLVLHLSVLEKGTTLAPVAT